MAITKERLRDLIEAAEDYRETFQTLRAALRGEIILIDGGAQDWDETRSNIIRHLDGIAPRGESIEAIVSESVRLKERWKENERRKRHAARVRQQMGVRPQLPKGYGQEPLVGPSGLSQAQRTRLEELLAQREAKAVDPEWITEANEGEVDLG